MLLYHATIYRVTQTIPFTEYWCIESTYKGYNDKERRWQMFVQTT